MALTRPAKRMLIHDIPSRLRLAWVGRGGGVAANFPSAPPGIVLYRTLAWSATQHTHKLSQTDDGSGRDDAEKQRRGEDENDTPAHGRTTSHGHGAYSPAAAATGEGLISAHGSTSPSCR